MNESTPKRRAFLWALLSALLTFLVTFSSLLYTPDKWIADPLYQRSSTPDHRIRIIKIDEPSMQEYGEFSDWQRDLYARLLDTLYADPDAAPDVVAFDVIFQSERDAAGDAAFAEACSGRRVVTAANLTYRAAVSQDGGQLIVDRNHISEVAYPYPALRGQVTYGFANTWTDRDQFIRDAGLSVVFDGASIDSFAAAVYRAWAAENGTEPVFPQTDDNGLFSFSYTGKPENTYEAVSFKDVLNGTVPASAFRDCIVLVGAYSPGMQDSYNVPISRGTQMYGVEIQANILEAMMEGRTQLRVGNGIMALAAALIAFLFTFACLQLAVVPAALLLAALIAGTLVCGRVLFDHGWVIRVIEVLAAIVIVYAVHLAAGYIAEILKKRKILGVFKQYVSPQVVEEVSRQKDFSISLGGRNKDIAVLFVDIRGFTPMSEGLQPEQVVEILNEYLALTTGAIFKNNGTLDKFIGDATMAVFNSPFDLDDYVYRAVCTARDIAAGSDELEKKLMERFGKSVSFGIGVNCGPAVVGNIGCDFRMDYTAIGDTVNTAARLESNAKRGQILISDAVAKALEGRIKVSPVGNIPLKGKSNEVFVWQLDEVL